MSLGRDVDGEALLVAALVEQLTADGGPTAEVGTRLPPTLPQLIVRVTLAPGSTSRYDTSTLRLDVESFAATRDEARDLAGRVHRAAMALPGRRVQGQQFDAVNGGLPIWLFWSESRHRFLATYDVDARVL